MKKRKVGRNSPCPCGSGKKFKKCCYDKASENLNIRLKDEDQILPPYNEIDYGPPKLDDNFYISNTISELSPQRLIYSCLLNPEVEKLASKITNRVVNRGKAEKTKIKNINDPQKLFEMLVKGVDTVNKDILKEKLLHHKDILVPLILDELRNNEHTCFVELAIRIIYASNIECSKELFEIVKNIPSNAYKTSLLCMLLGFYCKKEYSLLLWNYYQYFKEHYPDETYCDGPLLGLIEMRAQEKEKSAFLSK